MAVEEAVEKVETPPEAPRKRGRPRKNPVENGNGPVSESISVPKKRGRPKGAAKAKKAVAAKKSATVGTTVKKYRVYRESEDGHLTLLASSAGKIVVVPEDSLDRR